MSDGQHQDAWSLSVQSEELKESIETKQINGGGEGLTEHDYIGLCNTTQAGPHGLLTHTLPKKDDEFVCGDTELRLGIGPYKGSASPKCMPEGQQDQVLHCQEEHVANRESQLQRSLGPGTSNLESCQTFWQCGPGIAPGRFMIPVPKVSAVPAKRPFTETIADNAKLATMFPSPSDLADRPLKPSFTSNSTLSMMSGAGGGLHAWTIMPSPTSPTWQHGIFYQDHGKSQGSLATDAQPHRALPHPPSLFKVPPSPSMGHNYTALPQPPSPVTVPPPGSSDEVLPPKLDSLGHDNARSKAPVVVGWPPVRSFRKNNLQSTGAHGVNKANNAAVHPYKKEDAATKDTRVCPGVGETPLEASNGSAKSGLFVKAKLDGVRICRKVDLKSHDSYESLKSALQEMFQGFICNNESVKLDLLHGNSHVLTHEDKDGDWMLVGDVPWHMFVTSTVKSFRIMKASDARGLGGKPSYTGSKLGGMNC